LTPDGFISEASPEYIILRYAGPEAGERKRREDGDEVCIGRTDNRLTYEIRSKIVLRARR
jgi:hypothetical protein